MQALTVDKRYAQMGGGFTHGFDYLRLGLAAAIVVHHSFIIAGGQTALEAIWGGTGRVLWGASLPMFFALSGFLVAGSLKRQPTIAGFMTLRAMRLVPALAVEVFLSAFVLGPLLTTLPVASYFHHGGPWVYLANIVGWIHFKLPGVFATVPYPGIVNGSLWTVPFELECYALLMVLYLFGAIRTRWAFLAAAVIYTAIGTGASVLHPVHALTIDHPAGRSLISAFLFGVVGNLYSDKLVLSRWLALASVAVTVPLLATYQTGYLVGLPLAYLTIYLGMLNPPKIPVLMSGDYSYGLYLFAFPIQQALAQMLGERASPALIAVGGLVLGLVYAAGSWWFIESKVLKHKKAIVQAVERIVGRIPLPVRGFHMRPALVARPATAEGAGH